MRFMEKILYSLAKKASHYDINLITINLKNGQIIYLSKSNIAILTKVYYVFIGPSVKLRFLIS